MDLYDGSTAECLALLVREAQAWVASLSMESVHKLFVECLKMSESPDRVSEAWGTPASIRAWLALQGATLDASEPRLAAELAYSPRPARVGQSILAQEKDAAKRLEDALVKLDFHLRCRAALRSDVASQEVSAAVFPSSFCFVCVCGGGGL
jgi:hypothetical protein